jgi:hypothetical protein
MLSLLLPFGVALTGRLFVLRPRGQGQQVSLLASLMLVGGWILSAMIALLGLAEPTGRNISTAFALILGATVVGILLPDIFSGGRQATTAWFSRPRNWLITGVIGLVLYGLFFDFQIMGVILTIWVIWMLFKFTIGWMNPPKKGGK